MDDTNARREAGGAPELTIIVPTYKRPGMLLETLQSIQCQTYSNFVVKVCDNSPECEASAVVLGLQDERFHYVSRGRNLGILKNVMQAFRATTTKLVMEVDDDDVLYEDCLSELVRPFHEYPDLAVSFADVDVVDVNGAVLPFWERLNNVPLPADLPAGLIQPFTRHAARGDVLMVTSILRRSVVDWENIPPDVGTAYDRFLALSAARRGRAAFYNPARLVKYRVHPRGDTRMNIVTQFRGAACALEAELPYSDPDSARVIRRQLVRAVLNICRNLRLEGRYRELFEALNSLNRYVPRGELLRLLFNELGPVQCQNWIDGRRAHLQQTDDQAPSGFTEPKSSRSLRATRWSI